MLFRSNTATKEVTKETNKEATKEVAPPAARETDADAPADDAGQRGQQETASSTNDELRISSESPRVAVQMVGPEAITIGKAAKYTVVIVNDGQEPAHDIQVRLAIPEGVEILQAESNHGSTQRQAETGQEDRKSTRLNSSH